MNKLFKPSSNFAHSMKYLFFPLRLTIPAILLFMGSIAGSFSYQQQVSLTHKRVEEQLTQHAKLTATSTAQLLEYLYRRTDIQNSQTEGVTLLISRLSGDRNLKFALFCNEQNLISNASDYKLKNQSLNNTLWADLIPVVDQVRTNQAGQIIIDQNRRSVIAIHPVVFPPSEGKLRSDRVGAIVLDYDLNKATQWAIANATNQSLQMIGILVILCVLVGFILNRIVTQRARILVLASNQLAQRNFHVRVNLQGADELAQIAQAFNYMAAEIQHNTEVLQKSEQQLKTKTEELENTLQELSQTQTQLIQQEKMSSLGHLVAGVAHEINNPVNFIHGNLTHLELYFQDLLSLVVLYQECYPKPLLEIEAKTEEIELHFLQEDLPKILDSMKVGTKRIRQIVLSLRNFSRMDEAEFKQVDIHEGIESTLLILQHRLKATAERPEITIIRNYGNLPDVECYSGQLNQVLMNILANAIDALEEKKDSCSQIKISTSVIDSHWVKIAIADNGPGISAQIKSKIFNPFFTTKPVGKGTGLGMSISYQIITEKHGGKLECFSTPGIGTEFIIEIPTKHLTCNLN
jgi:signal transduction histidine kinase